MRWPRRAGRYVAVSACGDRLGWLEWRRLDSSRDLAAGMELAVSDSTGGYYTATTGRQEAFVAGEVDPRELAGLGTGRRHCTLRGLATDDCS